MSTAEMIGLALYEYRKRNKLSRRKLAEMIGMSEHHLFDIEKGNCEMRTSTIDAIIKATGLFELAIEEDDYKYLNLGKRPGVAIWRRPELHDINEQK